MFTKAKPEIPEETKKDETKAGHINLVYDIRGEIAEGEDGWRWW